MDNPQKDCISDEDWNSLKVGDTVILKHRNTQVKVTKVNGKSIFINKRLFSCPIYFQYEVLKKVK